MTTDPDHHDTAAQWVRHVYLCTHLYVKVLGATFQHHSLLSWERSKNKFLGYTIEALRNAQLLWKATQVIL